MGRSIKGIVVAAFVVAIASLAIFASAAFASSYNGYHAVHSCYRSPVGGISNANNTPAGYQSNSAVLYYYANSSYPCYYY